MLVVVLRFALYTSGVLCVIGETLTCILYSLDLHVVSGILLLLSSMG